MLEKCLSLFTDLRNEQKNCKLYEEAVNKKYKKVQGPNIKCRLEEVRKKISVSQNIMTFNKCSISGKCYGDVLDDAGQQVDPESVSHALTCTFAVTWPVIRCIRKNLKLNPASQISIWSHNLHLEPSHGVTIKEAARVSEFLWLLLLTQGGAKKGSN